MQADLFESKVDRAIRRLQDNAPEGEPYYGATSGGKDSVCIMRLAEMAGVDVEWYYNVTTVDPPELVRFIRHHHPHVKFNRPKMTMWQLIVKKRMPPTRVVRYCCEYLKEHGGDGRTVITGVRRSESSKRSNRQAVECFSRKGFDVRKIVINPIIDWTTNDVWGFIRQEKIPYCSLYDEGFVRLGCVGCPMGNTKQQQEQFQRWPHFKKLYIRAFGKMLENRLKDDIVTEWTSAQGVFDWWLANNKKKTDDAQMTLFE
jgi:phosphoadenosine phosphosulfate reductase